MSKIKKASSQVKFPEVEKDILKFWKDNNIFKKSLEQRPENKMKAFYDGPITANGMPHHGHMLTFAIKDLFPRYWTMKGYKVPRSLGWDCQGIPVEYEIEKKLGFKEKKDIEKFGVAEFNKLCKESVLQYRGAMIELEEKMGRLTNTDEEYATMDADYIESIWWSLKELHSKGLLYEGFKVVPYSTRAGTTLSNAEVALGGYKPFVDPAVTVEFKLKSDPTTMLLAWTTTPWTLPTNFGLAVGKDIEYVKVTGNIEGNKYILAKDRLEAVFKDSKYEILETLKAEDLVGLEYIPLFNYFPNKLNAYKVYEGFHVTTDSGTGIVHLAPYGAEDNEIFKEVGIESIDVLNEQGDFTKVIPDYAGMNYRDANPKIIEYLEKNDLLFEKEDYTHDMPMCWRTNTPLIYKPITSWYIAMSTLRDRLVNNNEKINWTPSHAKHGRFGNWLAEIKDWGISRLRYWGTPLPIWKSESGKVLVISSFDELETYSGIRIEDPHRPYIDEIEFDFEGEHYKRIPDVLDVWYDSGAMPFARFHYPFENKEKFENKFPAEFIAEGIDQTRGWFYTLHAISTALFDSEAFKNVVINGFILDDHGAKLSKSKKNYSDPDVMLQTFGADAIRINFFSTPIVSGEDTSITDSTVKLTTQEAVLPLWNIYTYLTTYAEMHNFEPREELARNERKQGDDKKWDHMPFGDLDNVLDTWLLTRLQDTIKNVTDELERYDIQKAMSWIRGLVDDISKWYIRRSRDRFVNGDKSALEVLYYTYIEVLKLLAPFAPFLPEFLYRNLVREHLSNTPESIHLTDYPEYDITFHEQNYDLTQQMDYVRGICSLGQSIRVENGLKLRQPLEKALVTINNEQLSISNELVEIIKEELNVKAVELVRETPQGEGLVTKTESGLSVTLDTNLTQELKEEGLLAELKRQVQNFRKTSGLKMGEFVNLQFSINNSQLRSVVEKYKVEIMKEVSASEIEIVETLEVGTKVKIDENELVIGLK